jgi:hypothetical protein
MDLVGMNNRDSTLLVVFTAFSSLPSPRCFDAPAPALGASSLQPHLAPSMLHLEFILYFLITLARPAERLHIIAPVESWCWVCCWRTPCCRYSRQRPA